MDNDRTGSSNGAFRLRISAVESPSAPAAVLRFDSIAFHGIKGAYLGALADIAVDGASLAKDALTFNVNIAPESLREISVDFTLLRDGAKAKPRRFSDRIDGKLLSTSPWRAEVRMEANLGALARDKAAPFRFIAAAPATGVVFDLAERTGDGFAIESLFRGLKAGAAIRLDAADLGDAGKVTLSERDPATLTPLLPGQTAFGPAVHVASDHSPTLGARLRLPYVAEAVRAAGLAPADLVVLALDDEQTRYRELHPVAVDESGATLTVVTDSFSTFFPGSPGIRIDAPRLYVNGIGERVGYSSALELMLAGEVTDDQAIVEVDGVVADRAGLAFGRGNIPLPFAGDRVIEVTARLPDRPNIRPHTVAIAVRRHPPVKRVALGSPLYGHELAVDTLNRPYVSYGTAIGPAGGGANDVEAFIAGDWNQLLSHYGHRLARTQLGDSEVSWTSIDITDPAELHEEFAASVIAEYQRLSIPSAPPIHLAPADPVATRAIRSIAAFIAEHRDDFLAIAALYSVFRLRWPEFALGVMTYSPTAPVAVLPDGVTLGAAYVHATHVNRDAAQASGVGNRLRELFVRATPVEVSVTNAAGKEERVIQDIPLEPTAVAAGRLMYVEMSPYDGDGRTRSERVAEAIWCSRIALEVDPRTGQPVIAAIGVGTDLDGVGPRSRLLLYRRQVDGRWTETLIDDQSAYVDVDLALETDGDPRLVTCVSAAGGGFRLVEITAAGAGWSVQPLLWSLPGIAASNIGACPRIVIDSGNRSVVAFVADETASPRYVAGVKRGARWSFEEVDALSITDIFGAALNDTDAQAGGQIVRASGQSLFHFSPALANARRGEVHCAFGGGALHVAVIDTNLGSVRDRRVLEVDRSTGFAPALARRTNATCAVVYRDLWGAGLDRSFGTSQPIHFFSQDSGPFLPRADAPADAPIFQRRRFPLTPLFNNVGLTCGLLDAATARDTLRSAVFNNVFNLRLYPEGSSPLPWWFGYWYTHNRLADMIWRLPLYRPAITQLSILSTRAGDNIERVDLLVPGVMMELKPRAASALNARLFTLALRRAFASHGLALASREGRVDAEIRLINPDENGQAAEWEIVANDPLLEAQERGGTILYIDGVERALPPIIFYTLTTADDRINVSVRPLISITQPDDLDPRPVAHYVPCGFLQPHVDEFAGNVADEINEAFNFDFGDDFGVDRIDRIGLTGIRMSNLSWVSNSGRQQGAFLGELTLPHIAVRGSHTVDIGLTTERFDFRAETRSPSTVTMEIAPRVTDNGRLTWDLRQTGLNLATFDVDVDVSFDKAFLVAVLGSGILKAVLNLFSPALSGLGATAAWAGLFGDPIADTVVTSVVNDRELDFDVGGVAGFVRDLFREHTDNLLESSGPVESCFLDGPDLYVITRQYVDEGIPDWTFIRSAMRFSLPTGGQPALLSDAIQNFGSVPAVIVDIRIENSNVGLSLFDPPMLPARVGTGNFLDFRVQFDPTIPGFHETRVTARDLAGRVVSLPILATADPPFIEVVLSRLTFGLVPAGEERILPLRVANNGRGALTLTGLQTTHPAFAATVAVPIVIPGGGQVDIGIRFVASSQPGTASGQLTIASNAPNAPAIAVDLVAVVRPATASILLNWSRIDFPAFPVDPQLPPIAAQYRTLQISNIGVAAATLLGQSFQVLDEGGQTSSEFMVLAGNVASLNPQPRPLTDQTILPGALLEILIRFRPTQLGPLAGAVVLDFAGAIPDITVPLTGEGVAG